MAAHIYQVYLLYRTAVPESYVFLYLSSPGAQRACRIFLCLHHTQHTEQDAEQTDPKSQADASSLVAAICCLKSSQTTPRHGILSAVTLRSGYFIPIFNKLFLKSSA